MLVSNISVPQILAINEVPNELMNVISNNSEVFKMYAKRNVPDMEFKIETSGIPRPAKAYRLSPDKLKAARAEIESEIKLGRMRRSNSNYASPFFPVKKPDGSWRFVADYSALNSCTVKDNYFPPRIDDLLARIPNNCIFSKLDLKKAFFQIPIREEDQHKTAVITPFGLYEYTVMPMGLKNASQCLQRYIDKVLSIFHDNVIVYCDDILLFSSKETHHIVLDQLLKTLFDGGLVVNKAKSEFFVDRIQFLGHVLTSEGYCPSEAKIMGISEFAVPKNIKQVRRFNGLANFYRKFVPHLSEIQIPLTKLTKKGVDFNWTEECQTAFDEIKSSILHASQLRYPDINDEFVLTTDASGTAIGAALQSDKGPIGFFSSTLKDSELNYSVYDKELTAVFKAVQHFEWLLFGHEFTLQFDHKPLLYMFSKAAKIERRRRQVDYLSTFNMDLKYIPGKENIVADALSRDKSVDVVNVNQSFSTLSAEEILQKQNSDASLNAVQAKSCSSGVWRDDGGRILVPSSFRDSVINSIHEVSHTNALSTLHQIQLIYNWPKIRKHVFSKVSACLSCQSSKITRHTKPPYKSLGQHPKFSCLHIDVVGPLPSNRNFRYLITIFDRGSGWLWAYPTTNYTAETTSNSLINWISQYGVPEILISDRGSNFESMIFQNLVDKLGISKHRTSSYHPQANGAVERQHRRLKEALKAKCSDASKEWLQNLPMILLGLNNSINNDTGYSPAQRIFGRQLNVPGIIFDDVSNYFDDLPERLINRNDSYISVDLRTCEHVWVRKHCLNNSLSRPYTGPYSVKERNFDKNYFILNIDGKDECIALERLKPAKYLYNNISHTHHTTKTKKSVTFSL